MSPVWSVAVGEHTTSAVYEPALGGADAAVVVCAHGAGGSMADRSVVATANALRARGSGVVRFNFLYREMKRGRPDQMPVLQATVAAVVERARAELEPRRLVIGGRSMGGRAASMLAATG
ncbi:MAG: alpha/beta family hydrolase, partial [Gemmatimonadaceae bacterium]